MPADPLTPPAHATPIPVADSVASPGPHGDPRYQELLILCQKVHERPNLRRNVPLSEVLRLGDMLIELGQVVDVGRLGEELNERFGISAEFLRQRIWVSTQFPFRSQLRKQVVPLRGLSFAHLRAIAGVPMSHRADWAKLAAEQQWTLRQLQQEIRRADGVVDRQKSQAVTCCPECAGVLPVEHVVVTLRKGDRRRGITASLCGYSCAAAYCRKELSKKHPGRRGSR